ncbi:MULTISPECIES: hypothetical protein [unclassified Roseitalea]|uniref:hypothetical protein n=1 Tax=unclassified Roseitalea TaxID=2639107 RepID=UPI00273F9980|nr:MULTISPECIES: hypothetical protein [unclassified Roseitalea]
MIDPGNDRPPRGYDRATLIVAGLIFVGFVLLLYFLPVIMTAIGGDSPWLAGLAIAAVLVLPFAGLWLRGRARRNQGRRD